jgi:hypothetical protein
MEKAISSADLRIADARSLSWFILSRMGMVADAKKKSQAQYMKTVLEMNLLKVQWMEYEHSWKTRVQPKADQSSQIAGGRQGDARTIYQAQRTRLSIKHKERDFRRKRHSARVG